MDREKLLNKAIILSEYLGEGLSYLDISSEDIDPRSGKKYRFFPTKEEFESMETYELDNYIDAYRRFLDNLTDDTTDETMGEVRDAFTSAFSHEVSFTTKGV